MGMYLDTAAVIARCHKQQSLTGRNVVLIGRPTLSFDADAAREMLKAEGVTPIINATDADRLTRHRSSAAGLLSDRAFFAMLGVTDLKALDVSDYEGAEILCDLNKPTPDSLGEIADFIYDGSTLDNLFDPAQGLRNLAKMVRAGGLLVLSNMGSIHNGPYLLPSPTWQFDYLTLNGFQCQTFVIVYGYDGSREVFGLDPEQIRPGAPNFDIPGSGHFAMTMTVAEKLPGATHDRTPTQQFYRSKEEWELFLPRLHRPGMWLSLPTGRPFVGWLPPGWARVDGNGKTDTSPPSPRGAPHEIGALWTAIRETRNELRSFKGYFRPMNMVKKLLRR